MKYHSPGQVLGYDTYTTLSYTYIHILGLEIVLRMKILKFVQ